MKCSRCYADNALGVAVCTTCGKTVLPVEFCDLGHVLPPGPRQFSVCATQWPDSPPFSGHPILRGVLLVERGRLASAVTGTPCGHFECRDAELPLTVAKRSQSEFVIGTSPESDETVRLL